MTPQNQPEVSTIASMVDELGQLEKDLAPLKTKISRVESLRTSIREVAGAGQLPSLEIPVHGTKYTAILGPCGNQNVINFVRLVKAIKPAVFARFATCTLKALRANVTATVCEDVTSMAQIGPRSLKVFERSV